MTTPSDQDNQGGWRTAFDPTGLMEDVAEVAAQQALGRSLEIIADVGRNYPLWLMGHPHQLRLILTEFVTNAVEHTEQGEVVVAIREIESVDELTTMRFEVRDTGRGIPGDRLAHLFDKGRAYVGLGRCRRLADAMGGELGVESEPGQGTVVWLRMRFDHCKRAPYSSLTLPVPPVGARVLVVDDNEASRQAITGQLQRARLSVFSAADAESALVQITSARERDVMFDLVVLDMDMPGLDSAALARQLEAQPERTQVLGLVPSWKEGPNKNEKVSGLAAQLFKPVRRLHLLDTLERMLRKPTAPLPAKIGAGEGAVLIATNNLITERALTKKLTKLGYETTVVRNGVAAVEAVEQGRFVLVLLGVGIPGMDGNEAAVEIRRREGDTRRVPIVGIGAADASGFRSQCLDAGMNECLTEPIKGRELRKILTQLAVARERNR